MTSHHLHLQRILHAVGRVNAYTADGRDVFMKAPMAQDAVIFNLEIIGESIKRIGLALQERRPEVAWKRFASFGDALIQNYAQVDLAEVWDVVVQELPKLRNAIEHLANE